MSQHLAWLPLDQIRSGDNDRKDFDEDELWRLSESIAEIGLGMAVLVRPTPGAETPYQLVAGERRWRAHSLPPCKHLTTIKAIIDDDLTDHDASAMMLAENTGRVDLGIIAEGRAYAKRIEAGSTTEEIARQAGVAEFRVKWRLDMLTLCPEAQAALDAGVLPPGPALELRRLDSNLQVVALKAWVSNPTMGHLPFKKLCVKWATEAAAAAQVGLFADTDAWMTEAKSIKPKTHSVPTLRKMIADLLVAIELVARSDEDLAPFDKVLGKARDMI